MYKIYDVIQNILLLWTKIAFVRIFIFIFYVFKKLFYFAINFVTESAILIVYICILPVSWQTIKILQLK